MAVEQSTNNRGESWLSTHHQGIKVTESIVMNPTSFPIVMGGIPIIEEVMFVKRTLSYGHLWVNLTAGLQIISSFHQLTPIKGGGASLLSRRKRFPKTAITIQFHY